MSLYLEYYEEITTTNKNTTLKEEYDTFKIKIESKGSEALKAKLYSDFDIDSMPFELQVEMTRDSLNIAPHIWSEYDNELKGKLIAINIIKSRLELLRRFYDEMRSSSKSGKKV